MSSMAQKFAAVPPGADLTRPPIIPLFCPGYFFVPSSDPRSKPTSFQAAAGLSSVRTAQDATLIDPDPVTKDAKGVVYYLEEGEEEEFGRLRADYGKDFFVVPVRLVLANGEEVVARRWQTPKGLFTRRP